MPSFNYADTIRRIYTFIMENDELIQQFNESFEINQFIIDINKLQIDKKNEFVTDIFNFMANIGLLINHITNDSQLHQMALDKKTSEKIQNKGVIDGDQIIYLLKAILPDLPLKIRENTLNIFKDGIDWILGLIATILITSVKSNQLGNIPIPEILISQFKDDPYLEGKFKSDVTKFCEGLTWEIDFKEQNITPIAFSHWMILPLEKILDIRASNLKIQRASSSRKNNDFLKALSKRLMITLENLRFMRKCDILFDEDIEQINKAIDNIQRELNNLVPIVLNKNFRELPSKTINSLGFFQHAPKRLQDVTYAWSDNRPLMMNIGKLIGQIRQLLSPECSDYSLEIS